MFDITAISIDEYAQIESGLTHAAVAYAPNQITNLHSAL
jgi:hypothetical protein